MQKLAACLFLLSFMTACAGATPAVTALPPAVPFQTATPSLTHTPLPPLAGDFLPTPTSMTYTVVEGDTLNGIASRFGVKLETLLAANPGIQPAALPVGTILIIPAGDVLPAPPTPTPAPVPVLGTPCWPEADGGLWCFALLHNDYAETLENLSGQFTLLDAGSQPLAGQVAYGLLDTLPPGAHMPLAVHFAPPVSAYHSVRFQLLTATRLLPGDARYLPVMLDDTLVSIDLSGQNARVTGRVILSAAGTANTLWVLATAFDAAGQVVGLRRWESPETLTDWSPVSFDFSLSSLGPPIERVEFLAEARP
jgi:LysM repeat protein